MQLGVIADIHGNVDALERALADLEPRVDEILLVGDALHEYRFCNEVVEAARRLRMPYVLGNHELGMLGPHGAAPRSAPTVRKSNLDYLATVPASLELERGGKRILMVHGTPWPPYGDYVYPKSAELARFADLDVDVVLLGHTHHPMVERVGSTLVVNPGTLGAESRHPEHPGQLSYAVLDTESEAVEVCWFPDPRLPAPA